ncbi:MAG: two-component system, OmpR family, sensor histidine kinase PhoQ [Gammaproteobacteria bacterium]|nr:two-component system, OmpR family, sensor histidine kinase PhoQ [Gammaproteobacteria bacterium]
MHSLSRRLLISVSVPLALFFGVMMVVLDTGFRALSDRTLQQLLDSQMVALVAATEPQPGGGYAPPAHDIDSRLRTPRSGLFAQVRSVRHQWRSPSTAGSSINFGPLLKEGEKSVSYTEFGHDRVAIESRGIQFSDDPDDTRSLTFSVAASLSPYEEQLWRFRRQLFGWFSGLMLGLLAVLAALLRWVLAPVRRLEREIHEVEEGRSEILGGGYPRELSGVATNLNTLLVGERKRVARYRDTLGNLAHSLKTPLAVMQSSLSSEAGASKDTFGAEISRMTDIIAHQLKRAAASGGALLGQAPVEVAQLGVDLRATLLKVYAGKDLAIELSIAPGSQFVGDRGDFMELLGNLVDNACKWCRSHVRVTVRMDEQAGARERLSLVVEDDGPGISEENRARVLQRGVRTDENVPGHGLGLAMVRDTVDLYGGTISIDASPLGGARFSLRLPGR